VCFPIQNKAHRERIIADLRLYLEDNAQAWQLSADGRYARVAGDQTARISAQEELLRKLIEAGY